MADSDTFDPSFHPHRRLNPLTNEYVLVSPHRTKRPWNGQQEKPEVGVKPQYDPACYLCPENTRANGIKTIDFDHTHVFENDFAAVLPFPIPSNPVEKHPLLKTEAVGGGCDVIIFHRRHDLTLATVDVDSVERVVEEWTRIYEKRGKQEGVKYVQIFENRGEMMGCSNPHPHGQAWSVSTIPTLPATELQNLKQYAASNVASTQGAPLGPNGCPCLLCEYAHVEIGFQERVVVQNDHWVALVPWWATWPFEILLLPYKRHISSLSDLDKDEKQTFAEILSKVTKRYDNLFECSFPYSMGIHQKPVPSDTENEVAHLHLHFSPPLLRSASVRKFLVGFELMGEAQRDLTPEQAATRLRDLPGGHYLDSVKA